MRSGDEIGWANLQDTDAIHAWPDAFLNGLGSVTLMQVNAPFEILIYSSNVLAHRAHTTRFLSKDINIMHGKTAHQVRSIRTDRTRSFIHKLHGLVGQSHPSAEFKKLENSLA